METTGRIALWCFKEPIMKDVGLAYALRLLHVKGGRGTDGCGMGLK